MLTCSTRNVTVDTVVGLVAGSGMTRAYARSHGFLQVITNFSKTHYRILHVQLPHNVKLDLQRSVETTGHGSRFLYNV